MTESRQSHIEKIASMVMPKGPPPERLSDTEKAIVIDHLLRAWEENPEQRLGQLFANIANAPGNDPYYISDELLAARIKEYLK